MQVSCCITNSYCKLVLPRIVLGWKNICQGCVKLHHHGAQIAIDTTLVPPITVVCSCSRSSWAASGVRKGSRSCANSPVAKPATPPGVAVCVHRGMGRALERPALPKRRSQRRTWDGMQHHPSPDALPTTLRTLLPKHPNAPNPSRMPL